jgi:uncharacterized membrane protein
VSGGFVFVELRLKTLVTFLAAAATLLVLDGIWLSLAAPTYRRLHAGQLLDSFRVAPAIAFYFLYLTGLVVLIVSPALQADESYWLVAARAALFGIVAYGTYALTNYATLKIYGAQLAIMDLLWGPVLTALTALAATAAARHYAG